MAIYHLHAQIIKRSAGRSSVAAAAYRAGEKLHNEYDGITHDYTRKSGVVHSEIMLPQNAPKEFQNRPILWNAVEKSEKRKDSQTAREIDIALPVEFDLQEQIELVRDYIKDNFVDKGMCADFAIHDKQDGNPHAHIMLTTREVSAKGFEGKNRDWNKTELLEQWRESWADICNERLQEKGLVERIDHRTLKAQGIDREPTIHIGAIAKAMEKAGRDSDRVREYQEIVSQNKTAKPQITAEYMHELKQGHFILDKEINAIKQKSAETRREIQSLRFKSERITERAQNIEVLKKRIADLKSERQQTGLFKSKGFYDSQIQQIENSFNQATNTFKREFYVIPEEATAEAKRLEYKAKDMERSSERLQDRLAPLVAEKDIFAFEYQRQKLFAEVAHDGQKIKDDLIGLDKKHLQSLTPKEKLAYTQSERLLEMINERSFQRILDEVAPEQAYKLIKLRERERAREYERVWYR